MLSWYDLVIDVCSKSVTFSSNFQQYTWSTLIDSPSSLSIVPWLTTLTRSTYVAPRQPVNWCKFSSFKLSSSSWRADIPSPVHILFPFPSFFISSKLTNFTLSSSWLELFPVFSGRTEQMFPLSVASLAFTGPGCVSVYLRPRNESVLIFHPYQTYTPSSETPVCFTTTCFFRGDRDLFWTLCVPVLDLVGLFLEIKWLVQIRTINPRRRPQSTCVFIGNEREWSRLLWLNTALPSPGALPQTINNKLKDIKRTCRQASLRRRRQTPAFEHTTRAKDSEREAGWFGDKRTRKAKAKEKPPCGTGSQIFINWATWPGTNFRSRVPVITDAQFSIVTGTNYYVVVA